MTNTQGSRPNTPLCDECMRQLEQLLSDWHTFVDTLEPLVSDEERVRGHLLAVIEAVRACDAAHHQQ